MSKPYFIPVPARRRRDFGSAPSGLERSRIRLDAGELTIPILSQIGGYDGYSFQDFERDMKPFEDSGYTSVRLQIHSGGGDVFDGAAIRNALVALDVPVRTEVPGLAASSATLIALAGDTVAIGESARWMIHESWSVVVGNADEMKKTEALLRSIDEDISKIYAAKTGMDKEKMRAWMAAETWLTGVEAVEAGFADELLPDKLGNSRAKSSGSRASLNAWLQKHKIE